MTCETPSLAETRFLTIFEVATIMRVSKRTVYRLVHSGDLEAVKISGSFRIPDRAVQPRSSCPAARPGP